MNYQDMKRHIALLDSKLAEAVKALPADLWRKFFEIATPADQPYRVHPTELIPTLITFLADEVLEERLIRAECNFNNNATIEGLDRGMATLQAEHSAAVERSVDRAMAIAKLEKQLEDLGVTPVTKRRTLADKFLTNGKDSGV